MQQPTEVETVRGLRRIAYLFLAFIFFGLGLLGVILPGLPTTPFLLLMSYFLIRTSPALHQRVLKIPAVGRLLRDWDENRAVRRGVKWIAYVMVVSVVAVSLLTPTVRVPFKVAIVPLAFVGLWVVWRLPTLDQAS